MRIVIFPTTGMHDYDPFGGVAEFGKTFTVGTNVIGEYNGTADEVTLPNYLGKTREQLMVDGDWPLPAAPEPAEYMTEFYADDLLSALSAAEFHAIDDYTGNPTIVRLIRRLIIRKKKLITIDDPEYISDIGLLLTNSLVSQATHDDLLLGVRIT